MLLPGGVPTNLYAIGGQRMRGLSLRSLSYWTHPWAITTGKTWQRAKVYGDRLEIPAGPAGFASLRATARDVEGDSVTETVIRAYATK